MFRQNNAEHYALIAFAMLAITSKKANRMRFPLGSVIGFFADSASPTLDILVFVWLESVASLGRKRATSDLRVRAATHFRGRLMKPPITCF
jgi:hypothetical protein